MKITFILLFLLNVMYFVMMITQQHDDFMYPACRYQSYPNVRKFQTAGSLIFPVLQQK